MSQVKKVIDKSVYERSLLKGTENRVEALASSASLNEGAKQGTGEEVNPTYCSTRVLEVEPRVLRKNRIISYFRAEKMTDQIKILHTQVLNKMEEIGGNSLLIASANPLEGKTTTAINLAISISFKVGRTVLLVDADLRKPTVHRYFGWPPLQGLSDYLLRQAEIPDLLINPGIPKLVTLPGGTPFMNSSELLDSPRMQVLVNELKARYPDRFVIFDSSPLLSSADALVLSRFVDGILLVIESERTSAKDLEKVGTLLKDKTIIGTVFNKAKG